MTTAQPSDQLEGCWKITLPALELHVNTLELQQLIKWLNAVSCDVGVDLAAAITDTFTASLPLTATTCRWKGCEFTASGKVTVNTINGDMNYDVCAIHKRLIVPTP